MIHVVTAKIGSLLNLQAAIISLVAAVAVAIPAIGGTQAQFTAVTTNPGNLFQSAILTMTTDHPSGSFVDLGNLIPGDTVARTVTVQNTGSVPFTYTITASSDGPKTKLWKDKKKGIQVSVTGNSGQVYSGRISGLVGVPTGTGVPPGDTEVLTFIFSIPSSAGNSFQGLSQSITITYNATQLSGEAR